MIIDRGAGGIGSLSGTTAARGLGRSRRVLASCKTQPRRICGPASVSGPNGMPDGRARVLDWLRLHDPRCVANEREDMTMRPRINHVHLLTANDVPRDALASLASNLDQALLASCPGRALHLGSRAESQDQDLDLGRCSLHRSLVPSARCEQTSAISSLYA